jgi:hypothetical protein
MSPLLNYNIPRCAFAETEPRRLRFVDFALTPPPLARHSNVHLQHNKYTFPHDSYVPPIEI